MMLALLLATGCLEDAVQSGDTQSDMGASLDAGQDVSTVDQGATDMTSEDLDLGPSDIGADADPDAASEDMAPDLLAMCEASCSVGLVCNPDTLACVECFGDTGCNLDGEVCNDSSSCVCAENQFRCMSDDNSCALRVDCDNDPVANLDDAAGMVGLAIYVSQVGQDVNNTGLTPDSPVRTVAKAMELAQDHEAPAILFTEGDFVTTTWQIPTGSKIEVIAGGYDANFASRPASAITKFLNTNSGDAPTPTLSILSTIPVRLATLTLGAPLQPGQPVVTLRVEGTPLKFEEVKIERGVGADGASMADGLPGDSGGAGSNAATTNPGMGGGSCSGGNIGGLGGTGGVCLSTAPSDGNPGEGSSNGGAKGSNNCVGGTPASGEKGGNGFNGTSGGVGQNGLNGTGGGGGGGGGAGVGSQKLNGGGGGGGGCGGQGGASGLAGGNAIGIMALAGAQLDGSVTITGGTAGNGGDGGAGGCGGRGGDGGIGVSSSDPKGGAGGSGGSGGNGGSGNGGDAGRLVTVAAKASVIHGAMFAITIAGNRVAGTPGAAGAVCAPGDNKGADGASFPDGELTLP